MLTNDHVDAYATLEIQLQNAVKVRYSAPLQARAKERLNRELKIIKEQGTAERFLILSDALNATGATTDDFCLRGATGSLIVAYLLGLSCADPLDEQLPLYAEVCLGLDGERKPEMELNVDQGLFGKLDEYFRTKYGDEVAETKFLPDGSCSMIKIYAGRVIKNDQKFTINLITGDWTGNVDSFRENEIYVSLKTNDTVSLVKCYGLIQGTGTWKENAKELLNSGTVQLEDVIAFREDIYEMLLKHGFDKDVAFVMMNYIGKGIGIPGRRVRSMKDSGIPEWYIESCLKIAYLFPRAHAINMLKWCKLL